MRNIALALAAAFVLGACASTTNGGSASATAVAGTQYCWEGRLDNAGGKLTCNWASSKRDACEGMTFTAVDASRYAAPKRGSMCSNGQWLVELTPRG